MEVRDSFEMHQAARQLRSDMLGAWIAHIAITARTQIRAQLGRTIRAPKVRGAALQPAQDGAQCRA